MSEDNLDALARELLSALYRSNANFSINDMAQFESEVVPAFVTTLASRVPEPPQAWTWYCNQPNGGESWRCLRCRRVTTFAPDAVKACPTCDDFSCVPEPPQVQESKTCNWHQDCDLDGDAMWETSCGAAFQFNSDGPEENEFHFCYACGKPITVSRRSDDDEDENAPAREEP